MSGHEHYRELVAGYALSALEPEDEQALQRHLSACALCTRELVAARETAAQLAYRVEAVEPPAELFAAIRAEVERTDPDAFDAPQANGSKVIPLAPRRRLETRAAKIVAAAASISIASVVGLAAWNVSLHRDNVQQGEISASVQSALDLLKTEGGQTVVLRSADGSVDAVAMVHGSKVDLVTDGIAVNDAKRTRYVLWNQSNGKTPQAIGQFNVDDSRVDTVQGVTIRGGQPERLIVSLEPGTTSSQLPVRSTTLIADGDVGA